MRQKVSDYIAEYIAQWGIRDVFTVTGGGAMHMNDAFGHHPNLHCTYQHHEQACAMAAEAYARMDNRMAAVCVTTGPGATNAITGVLGGWMDSIPMLVFSGQARYATTVAASGLPLRSMGVQECNIVPVVSSITKYAHMVIHPEDIRYHLEKALYMAVTGRPDQRLPARKVRSARVQVDTSWTFTAGLARVNICASSPAWRMWLAGSPGLSASNVE